MKGWSTRQRWEIITPEEMTCYTPWGYSKPDLLACRAVQPSKVKLLVGEWRTTSDHQHIQMSVTVQAEKVKPGSGQINITTRHIPRIIHKAQEQ